MTPPKISLVAASAMALLSFLGISALPEEKAVAEEKALPADLGELAWLAGCWCGGSEGGEEEECWMSPRGTVMPGLHRDVAASGRTFFEYLRIAATEEGVVFYASPGGRTSTAFPLVHLGVEEVVFENPGHDWPQRLTYRRLPEGSLAVRAEGAGGSQPREWSWRPCGGDLAGPAPAKTTPPKP
jgi:hypothetical protein